MSDRRVTQHTLGLGRCAWGDDPCPWPEPTYLQVSDDDLIVRVAPIITIERNSDGKGASAGLYAKRPRKGLSFG